MPRQSKQTLIKKARREYDELDRAYHKIGDKAMGKPKTSAIHRDYVAVKRERNRVGRHLGKLTGRKPRR
ncbi:MAG TPA: hypothetical protein VMS77_09505 [Conexivisphaerales archaeon]|nr:hypothetical protein [Conexivisphaerales archaeon]